MAMKGSAAWILAMNSSGKIVYWAGVTTTPISDGSTTNPVTINGSSVTIRPGGAVGYNGNEFVLSENGVWQQFGETDVQHKTLDTPIDVDGTEVTTVEGALGAINGYAEDIDESLGTASAKNAISVVTDSSDLVESGAVKDIVGWGNANILNADVLFAAASHHGINLSISNQIISLNGTVSGDVGYYFGNPNKRMILPAGVYTFSIVGSGNFGTASEIRVRKRSDSSRIVGILTNNITPVTFTLDADTEVFIAIVNSNASIGTSVNATIKIQLEKGTTATAYEPYHASVANSLADKMSYADNGVLGAKNLIDTSVEKLVGVNTKVVNTDTGLRVYNTSAGTYQPISFLIDLPKDTDLCLVSTAQVTKGKGSVSIVGIKQDDPVDILATSSEFTISTNIKLLFNSSNIYKAYRLYLFCTRGTSEEGDISYNDLMISLATDTDPTYAPYAKTNLQLTQDLTTKLAKTTVARDESSLVASKAYVVGEEFLINDILYKAKLPINQGDTLALNANYELAGSVGDQLKSINDKITILDNKIFPANVLYAFHIDGNESDPLAKVTYLEDCAGFTPAYMDFQNGVFRYGSWSEDEFFMPKPCMLKYDGTVDYYLAKHDFTKKADGITASDVADTAYAGNAMLEFGRDDKKIWYKIVPDSGDSSSFTVYIADGQLDEDFHCWSFINNQGILVPRFYTSIYNGSIINDVMRSISGQAVSNLLTGTQEREKARANNQGEYRLWDIECFADWQLIEFLTWLISRSTDSQKAFGTGLTDSGTEAINNDFRTGVHNAKGLFYGTNSGAASTYTNAIKVFGKENLWGFQWRRLNGWCMYDGIQKIKLTKGTQDGSTATDYNDDGTNYLSMGSGSTPSGSSGGYCKNSLANANAVVPQGINGNSVSHYCDGLWFNNSGARFALVGGHSSAGARCGVSCAYLSAAVSDASWNVGASLSCKPLA